MAALLFRLDATDLIEALAEFKALWPGRERLPRHLRERIDNMLDDPQSMAVTDGAALRASPEFNAILAGLRMLQ